MLGKTILGVLPAPAPEYSWHPLDFIPRCSPVADIFTKSNRSAVMRRIRGKGNKDTELRLIAIFRANGITGWRRGRTIKKPDAGRQKPEAGGRKPSPAATARCPPGQRAFSVKPDFVFPKLRLAVFVDGCFWHGCPKHVTWPKQNAAFWRKKILGNRARDRRVNRELRALGWRVVRVWEHELARNNVFM